MSFFTDPRIQRFEVEDIDLAKSVAQLNVNWDKALEGVGQDLTLSLTTLSPSGVLLKLEINIDEGAVLQFGPWHAHVEQLTMLDDASNTEHLLGLISRLVSGELVVVETQELGHSGISLRSSNFPGKVLARWN